MNLRGEREVLEKDNFIIIINIVCLRRVCELTFDTISKNRKLKTEYIMGFNQKKLKTSFLNKTNETRGSNLIYLKPYIALKHEKYKQKYKLLNR